ncbi:MAG: hypothetical protein WAX57_03580, partial [Minisyncoccia bacterium]
VYTLSEGEDCCDVNPKDHRTSPLLRRGFIVAMGIIAASELRKLIRENLMSEEHSASFVRCPGVRPGEVELSAPSHGDCPECDSPIRIDTIGNKRTCDICGWWSFLPPR